MASNNRSLVPEARAALDKFKMEAASDVGVTLKNGYNGDLTSKQAGSIGGQMVNIICPERTMKPEVVYLSSGGHNLNYIIAEKRSFNRNNRTIDGHFEAFTYMFGLKI